VTLEHALSTPGSQFSIEPATWRDLNSVRHLEQACFPKDAWPLWDLIGILSLPNVVRLKAVSGGNLVGFVAGDIRPADKFAWIATIGVLPEFRNQGIATALLAECEGRLPVPRVQLCVRASNRTAIRLYDGLGYHRMAIWPRYYHDGEDAIVMEKRLGGGEI